ncbi:DUF4132 domain-containing protein [Pseudovibrio ascidiaceicola]|uniref:DUF4132 domain-containing protein n=1 Tax=Pseudovibrio ascidiaceicola TaxID=285279 RepID=UPI003D360355
MFWKKFFKFCKSLEPLSSKTNFSTLVDEFLHKTEARIYTKHSLRNPYKLECDAYTKLKSVPAAQKPDLLLLLFGLYDSWENKALQARAENDCLQLHSEEKKCLLLKQLQIDVAQTPMLFAPGKFRELCDRIFQIEEQWRARELLGITVVAMHNLVNQGDLSDGQKYEVEGVLETVQPYFFFADASVEADPSCKSLSSKNTTLPFTLGSDQISQILKGFLQDQKEHDQMQWCQFFKLCRMIEPSTVPDFWLEEATRCIGWIGQDSFQQASADWIYALSQFEFFTEWRPQNEELPELFCAHINYIVSNLAGIMTGVCWSQALFKNESVNAALTVLARKCAHPYSCFGNCAGTIGDAAIYALAHFDTRQSMLSLASLKSYAHLNKTQELINTYLRCNAKKLGLTTSKAEELTVPDFGLINGKRVEVFDNCHFVITYSDTGRVKTHWIGHEGKTQNNPPIFIAQNPALSRKLKQVRDLVKQITHATKIQEKRIKSLTRYSMSWSLEELEELYINHGLICSLARNLIWVIESRPVLWASGQWQQVDGEIIIFSAHARAQIWKPEAWPIQDALAWQNRLDYLERPQVIKQVFQ